VTNVTKLKRHLTLTASLGQTGASTIHLAMQIQLNKARKLIDQLEKTLNDTATHTNSARDLLGQWLTKGEAQLRAKSATALKQVRKRADRFTDALTDLEKNLAKSLDKLADQVDPKASTPSKKPAAKAAKSKPAAAKKTAPAKTAAKKTAPAAKPSAKKTATKKAR
jgi:alpha-amylase/alpha-mannosidase (GH57 family)